MKKYILLIYTLFLLIVACSKSSSSNHPTKNCNISLPTFEAGADGSVVYSVTLTGNGKVSQLTYLSTDSVAINSPALPYQVSIPVFKGAAVGLTVIGTTSGGTLTAAYSFTATNGSSNMTDSISCGN